METAHDVVVLGARTLLADLSIDAPRHRASAPDATLGLDLLVAEHLQLGPLEVLRPFLRTVVASHAPGRFR